MRKLITYTLIVSLILLSGCSTQHTINQDAYLVIDNNAKIHLNNNTQTSLKSVVVSDGTVQGLTPKTLERKNIPLASINKIQYVDASKGAKIGSKRGATTGAIMGVLASSEASFVVTAFVAGTFAITGALYGALFGYMGGADVEYIVQPNDSVATLEQSR